MFAEWLRECYFEACILSNQSIFGKIPIALLDKEG